MMLLPVITTIIGLLCVSVPCRTASDIRCAPSVVRRRASFVAICPPWEGFLLVQWHYGVVEFFSFSPWFCFFRRHTYTFVPEW